MLIAVEHLGSVGVGITSPQYFRANDGRVYVVKLQNNRLGLKVLVNEFLAAKIGELMYLRFPPSNIIETNEETLQRSPLLAEQGVNPGRHFASQYLDNTEYLGKSNLEKASNVSEMAGIILFDHMFHNADRTNNRKNILLRREADRYTIYAIDNSHLFRSGKWTLDSITNLEKRKKTYYRFSFGMLLKDCLSPQDFLPYLDKVTTISNGQIDQLVQAIPSEWLPDAAERQALAQYIKIRCNMAEEIWNTLCKYIPKARGGRRLSFGRKASPTV
ncbi:hypothetical protein SCACP_17800 [Sporomusa carbonis]|uniref:HipA family kinase n=1 Tax=Sporomusa carbonis TaxID=3076075 RepID=UPI003A69E341